MQVAGCSYRDQDPLLKLEKQDVHTGSAGNSAGLIMFADGMTVEEVQAIVTETCAKKDAMAKDLNSAQRAFNAATKSKNEVNVIFRKIRIRLNDLKAKLGTISSPQESADLQNDVDRIETERDVLYRDRLKPVRDTKRRAYDTYQKLDQLNRQYKSVIYAGQKILQSNGALDKSAKKTDRISLVGLKKGSVDLEKAGINIKKLFTVDVLAGKEKRVGVGGSDRGHVYMNASSAMGGRRAIEKVKEFAIACKNRFEVLADMADKNVSDAMSVDEDDDNNGRHQYDCVHVVVFKPNPDVNKVRGKKLKELTHVRENRRSMNRAAKRPWRNPVIIDKKTTAESPKDAYKILKDLKRPETTLDPLEIKRRQDVRKKVRGPLQLFQNTPRRSNQRRTLSMRKRRIYTLLANQERLLMLRQAEEELPCEEARAVIDKCTGWCSRCNKVHIAHTAFRENEAHVIECPKIADEKFETTLLYFEGKEGIGSSSPFGGHDRWAGNTTAKILSQTALVLKTPEHGSSCNCSFCAHRLQQAWRTIVKDGKLVKKRVHGMLECRNPDCPAVKRGRAIKMRDGESSMIKMMNVD